MHPWKPGDLGVLLDIDEGYPFINLKSHDRVVEVLSTPFQRPEGTWHVKIESFEQEGYYFDEANVLYIRPVPGDETYDGHETSTWDECPWQPKELIRVETET
jgi:hypothetical protein